MSKKKKTRQQKMIADLRRQIQTTSTDFSLPSETSSKFYTSLQKPRYPVESSVKNPYVIVYTDVSHDILKTSVLTLGILGFEVVLFFLLKNHIIRIPFVQF